MSVLYPIIASILASMLSYFIVFGPVNPSASNRESWKPTQLPPQQKKTYYSYFVNLAAGGVQMLHVDWDYLHHCISTANLKRLRQGAWTNGPLQRRLLPFFKPYLRRVDLLDTSALFWNAQLHTHSQSHTISHRSFEYSSVEHQWTATLEKVAMIQAFSRFFILALLTVAEASTGNLPVKGRILFSPCAA